MASVRMYTHMDTCNQKPKGRLKPLTSLINSSTQAKQEGFCTLLKQYPNAQLKKQNKKKEKTDCNALNLVSNANTLKTLHSV